MNFFIFILLDLILSIIPLLIILNPIRYLVSTYISDNLTLIMFNVILSISSFIVYLKMNIVLATALLGYSINTKGEVSDNGLMPIFIASILATIFLILTLNKTIKK